MELVSSTGGAVEQGQFLYVLSRSRFAAVAQRIVERDGSVGLCENLLDSIQLVHLINAMLKDSTPLSVLTARLEVLSRPIRLHRTVAWQCA